MATLTSLVVKLEARIQDADNVLVLNQRESALQEALTDYARFRPRHLIADIVGDGGSDYDLPASWVDEFSVLERIELPLGDVPTTYLEDTDWVLYQVDSDTTVLRLLNQLPGPTQTMRLLYTGRHAATANSCTVPAQDEDAVVNKAAAICCTWLAAHYAQQGQASISADVTNHESKSRSYRELAKSFMTAYNNHLGIDSKDGSAPVAAASAVVDWDSSYAWGGDRLTHPLRWY